MNTATHGSISIDLDQTFGRLGEAIAVTCPDRRIMFVNQAMADLLGYHPSELVGEATGKFLADKAAFERLGSAYQAEPDGSTRENYSIDLKHADGHIIPVEVLAAPIINSNARVEGLLVAVRNVSVHQQLQDRIREIALTLEEALNAISEGFALYDKNDRLVICNENYRRIYSHSADKMVPGNSFEEILRYGLDNDQYDTGELSKEDWLAERLAAHLKADGRTIEQHLGNGNWLRISERKTPTGGIAGIRADITELKQARAQAERAYDNLTIIANSISASITELDQDGICLFANRVGASWFGMSPEDLVGCRPGDLLPPKSRTQMQSIFAKALAGDKNACEIEFHHPDGETRICDVEFTPKHDEQGNVVSLVMLANDITQRKRTERTLAELYAITSTRDLGHDEKIRQIIEIGCEQFRLPFGIISHIVNDHYTVKYATSPNGELVPGSTFPLKDTYCALTLQANQPLATSDAGKSVFASHPCYEAFKLESYIGAPLIIDGDRFGTINFSGPERGKHPFSQLDIQIIRQFADWISHEIARQRDHEALMKAQIHLERTASVDDLTQIWNRRAFMERANAEIERFRRTNQPVCAIMLDIDHFKDINDRYGHSVGDTVLSKFAGLISSQLRAVDVFGRIGGEEFSIALFNANAMNGRTTAERLRKTIETKCRVDGIEHPVTCSIGVAEASIEDIGFSSIMQRADIALYQAKTSGRNKVVVHAPKADIQPLPKEARLAR